MDCSIYFFWFPTDVLHDVNFTTFGPATVSVVGGHHPKGGPDALAIGHLDPGFHPTIGEVPFVDAADAGGGVSIAAQVFAFGGNFEQTIAHRGVFWAVIL